MISLRSWCDRGKGNINIILYNLSIISRLFLTFLGRLSLLLSTPLSKLFLLLTIFPLLEPYIKLVTRYLNNQRVYTYFRITINLLPYKVYVTITFPNLIFLKDVN